MFQKKENERIRNLNIKILKLEGKLNIQKAENEELKLEIEKLKNEMENK